MRGSKDKESSRRVEADECSEGREEKYEKNRVENGKGEGTEERKGED